MFYCCDIETLLLERLTKLKAAFLYIVSADSRYEHQSACLFKFKEVDETSHGKDVADVIIDALYVHMTAFRLGIL